MGLKTIGFQEKRSTRSIITHSIVWGVLLLLPYINFLYEPEKWATANKGLLVMQGISTLFLMLFFYFNLYFLGPKYLSKNRNWFFVSIIFLGLLIYIALNYYSFNHFVLTSPEFIENQSKRSPEDRSENWIWIPVVLGPTLLYSINILTSTMLYLFNERRRQKELNQLVELEKTAAELSMLKLQISPHFLFNTLNNIRWLVRKKSDLSEEAILKLSEILRYIIYEVSDKKVDISREIEHLKNYIELQKLRLPKKGNVAFTVQENMDSVAIQPLLFIHFVENAFKYGVDSKNEPDIQFEISTADNTLTFSSRNKILVTSSNLSNEGIGLVNIKRRLELLYPNKYELAINNDYNYFEVIMKLQLHED
ncbi:histidine kinase [uncultured Arcticibacterium sp.]|uniref:sensor histidine kinase n=1 Tax=uncultured Arcticibacterium sp. TaxID=2173042 RepID=UPI0030FA589A